MDVLATELLRLQRDVSLYQSIEDVDKILDQLSRARDEIAAGEPCTIWLYMMGPTL